jgi:beta-1,4-mannosyltransferase
MRVLFAPDYSKDNPYQGLLANALDAHGVKVDFLSDYFRGLPLFRGARVKKPDIIHIHWPEQYFQPRSAAARLLRVPRHPLDCWLTARYRPVVLTAHNLLPHNRTAEAGVVRNERWTAHSADAIFAHSNAARDTICEMFGISEWRIVTIPFGDHAASLGPPVPREEARGLLGLAVDEKVCLVFGTVSPYKGTDELVEFWLENHVPHRLAVVGQIFSEEFATRLYDLASGHPAVALQLSRTWLDDEVLHRWLSAADCAIFNYRDVFSSGAAALARSYGLPLLIPGRLKSVDLDEPHPHVFRFDALGTDFRAKLDSALTMRPDYELAREWRQKTSWDRVAQVTSRVYRDVLRNRHGPGVQ